MPHSHVESPMMKTAGTREFDGGGAAGEIGKDEFGGTVKPLELGAKGL